MKVLSFSLYGDNPIYTIGCIKNAILHKSILSEWEMWVYHNDTVPTQILEELKDNGVKLINTKDNRGFVGSMWRFLPSSEEGVDYFVSRDCDSRISERDEISINQWIESGKDFHIIRDHPVGHAWPMNAGMWGCRNGAIPNMTNIMEEYITKYPRYDDKSLDQCFLRDVIHRIAVTSLFLNDVYYNYEGVGVRINRDRRDDDLAFIGESIDEHDVPRGDQRSTIRNRGLW